ncbi:MAG: phosphoribosylglycinamide formyltransferase [Bacteroidia bacterium]
MKNIVIFASGSGSNAENIATYFKDSKTVNVKAVFTNNANAGVIEKMKKFQIPCIVFTKDDFKSKEYFLIRLYQYRPDLIVLAGFLWLVPNYLVHAYPNKMINIHPALLPKFGGKGMYGMHVHEAVKAANESETGITIHYVNQKFDDGKIIFKEKTQLTENDTPESIAQKIHKLEMANFPVEIERILK